MKLQRHEHAYILVVLLLLLIGCSLHIWNKVELQEFGQVILWYPAALLLAAGTFFQILVLVLRK